MLRDDIARYTELSGNDGEHTPIGIVGAFLDGYETGLKDRPKSHWITYRNSDRCECANCGHQIHYEYPYCPNCGADMRGCNE